MQLILGVCACSDQEEGSKAQDSQSTSPRLPLNGMTLAETTQGTQNSTIRHHASHTRIHTSFSGCRQLETQLSDQVIQKAGICIVGRLDTADSQAEAVPEDDGTDPEGYLSPAEDLVSVFSDDHIAGMKPYVQVSHGTPSMNLSVINSVLSMSFPLITTLMSCNLHTCVSVAFPRAYYEV